MVIPSKNLHRIEQSELPRLVDVSKIKDLIKESEMLSIGTANVIERLEAHTT
jgi:hypothetical protein